MVQDFHVTNVLAVINASGEVRPWPIWCDRRYVAWSNQSHQFVSKYPTTW